MQTDYQRLWDQCLGVIKDIIPDAAFNTWFKPITPLSYENSKFTIQVPSQFFYEYLEEKYVNVLKVTIERVIGIGTILNYRVMVDKTSGGTVDYVTDPPSSAVKKITPKDGNKSPAPFSQPVAQDLDSQLNPQYNFENFFEGKSNRLVRTAGETVALKPGTTTFNPLFFWGPSGVGKTHLCYAIANRVRELHPEKKVLYVSAHLFRIQYTDAIRKNTTNDFLYFYQNLDVLILDDVQDMIGMDKTQNTFFHIFNHLHRLNKQLVLTSDKAPVDMQGMEERLISRLKWGLPAAIERPDAELRRKILKNKISLEGVSISDEIVEYIVENVTENVRDLGGIIASLMANSVINTHDIDMALAKQVVSQVVAQKEPKNTSLQTIQEIVCENYNLDISAIQAHTRKRIVVMARQVAMYLSRNYTNYSLSHIGKVIGNKDHATVLHSIKAVEDQMSTDKVFRASVERMAAKLNS
jgi:chromosomal replication initiator protein